MAIYNKFLRKKGQDQEQIASGLPEYFLRLLSQMLYYNLIQSEFYANLFSCFVFYLYIFAYLCFM